MRIPLLLLAWTFLFGGLIASGALYRDFRDRSLLEQRGTRTTGTVVWSSRYGKPCASSIRVVYANQAKRTFSNYFNVCTNQYRTGQSVDLIYLPSDPGVARLSAEESAASGHHRTVGVLVTTSFMLVGAVLVLLLRRDETAPQP